MSNLQKPMMFIFQLTSNGGLDFTFGDIGGAYLFQCQEHREQLAFCGNARKPNIYSCVNIALYKKTRSK